MITQTEFSWQPDEPGNALENETTAPIEYS